MNEQRFEFLLQKYLDRVITPEEEQELKSLVRTGRYQNHIREDIARFMEEHFRDSKDVQVPVDADRLYKKILDRRHEEEIYEKPPVSLWYWTRVAAVLVFVLGAGWWFFLSSRSTAPVLTPGKSYSAEESVVRFTKKDFIKLPDGSTVLLNADSELSYRLPFGDGPREVTLKGEAFFDIIHDSGKPFVVHTGNISTNVLGTAFNVNARNRNVVVTVERGLVQVSDKTQTLSLVRPDEQLTVNTFTSGFQKTDVNAAEEIVWKSQSIILDDITLLQAADILQARFGSPIAIENPGIENCRISTWFLENESLDEILEMVFGTRQAHISKSDGKITVAGGIACEL